MDRPLSVGLAGTAATGAAIAGQAGPQVLVPEEVITVPGAFWPDYRWGSTKANFEIEAGHAYKEMLDNGISEETASKNCNQGWHRKRRTGICPAG